MKHIVLFINTLGSGGAEHQLVQLADGLVDRGYDVTITTFGDIPEHYVYCPQIHRHRIASQKSNIVKMMAIWWYFLTLKADWVIGFGQRESCYCLQALIWRSKNIHVIAGERNTTYGKPSRIEKLLMNVLYKRADYIVSNSYAQRQHIVSTKPLYDFKTVTIINYTDLKAYTPSSLPQSKIVRIGVFARYAQQKNCLRFAEAINKLKSCSSQPFIVEWYGHQKINGSPNPMYLLMKETVAKYGLQDVLILNDQIKDVSDVMSCFDAICLPSLFEGFSNSVSEAICCGKPCIVSNVADNGVMVKDGVNGLLFDPLNEDSIINAFIKFFSFSTEERKRMGLASRKRAEELFDYDRFIGEYVNLIESKKVR